MHQQIEKIIHLGTRYPSYLAEEAAVKVLEIAGIPDGKCTFLSSGSEAVEFGVQAARRISKQPLLLTFSDAYLAAYGSAGRKSADEWFVFDWKPCLTCPHTDACSPHCRLMSAVPFERIGGIVFEPGNTAGMVKFPPRQLVETLVDQIKQQHGLLVVNEITAGMGRTGLWFGHQHYGLRPDFIAMGKGLGNGYPVSAAVLSLPVAEKLENSLFHYAQSHQNDPLGCAVANEVITVMRAEGLVERSSRVGKWFLDELAQLAIQQKGIKEVRGRGLMIAIELDGSPGQIPVTEVYHQLLEKGFLVGYNPLANLLRFYPALIIQEEDILDLLKNLGNILNSVGSRSTRL